jgi:ATP/ADP translocase
MAEKVAGNRAGLAAVLCAAAMIANQVGGKAARDALFLSHYSVSALPLMLMASAVCSFAFVLASSHLLNRWSPGRVMPLGFGASALLLLAEWLLLQRNAGAAAVLLYIHMAALGAVLISGFWSVANERFDPRTAKRLFGRVAAGATFGGLVGGVLAERVAATMTVSAMLPALSLLHVICGFTVQVVAATPRSSESSVAEREEEANAAAKAFEILRSTPYVRNLAALVLLVTMSGATLDYAFKARAAEAYGRGEDLLRYFALFYTAVSVGTFAVQSVLSRKALDRLGLGRTVGMLPLAAAAGGVGALAAPGLVSAAFARGIESTVSDSLFRSGYEILYTAIPPEEKRVTKSFVDVGFQRLGDLLGGGIIRLLVQWLPGLAIPAVLGLGAGLALVGVWISSRINAGYVASLEKTLLNRADELDLSDVRDSTTRSVLMHSRHGFGPDAAQSRTFRDLPTITKVERATPSPQQAERPATRPSHSPHGDPMVEKVAALRSGDAARIRQLLAAKEPLEATLAGHVIPLLAWDDVFPDVLPALRAMAPRVTGQLSDALLDPTQPFAVRRRIPRVLAACVSERAADALLRGLNDQRFEVRFRCGLALSAIGSRNAEILPPADRIFAAVEKEAALGKRVWESQRLLDLAEDPDTPQFVDDLLRDRADRSLEHVFRLLSLVLPKEPLQIAFRGLHTHDESLRGTSLEYLESVLPENVRDLLWPYLEDKRPGPHTVHSPDEVLSTLIRSHQSIEMQLADLKKKRR